MLASVASTSLYFDLHTPQHSTGWLPLHQYISLSQRRLQCHNATAGPYKETVHSHEIDRQHPHFPPLCVGLFGLGRGGLLISILVFIIDSSANLNILGSKMSENDQTHPSEDSSVVIQMPCFVQNLEKKTHQLTVKQTNWHTSYQLFQV